MIKILNWNTQADKNPSDKPPIVRQLIQSLDADIICLTEAHPDYLPDSGYRLDGGLSGWRSDDSGARKVMLWSRVEWQQVDSVGDDNLPPGRFLSAYHPAGDLQVIAVCIPYIAYRYADIQHNWQGHRLYTDHLTQILKQPRFQQKTLLMGDFNVPVASASMRGYSRQAHDGVTTALKSNQMIVATRGRTRASGKPVIDHIATTPDLTISSVTVTDHPRSDHPYVTADLQSS